MIVLSIMVNCDCGRGEYVCGLRRVFSVIIVAYLNYWRLILSINSMFINIVRDY